VVFLGPAHFYEDDHAIKLRLKRRDDGDKPRKVTRAYVRDANKAQLRREARQEADRAFCGQFAAAIDAACRILDVMESDMHGPCRVAKVATARFVVSWIAHRHLGKSLPWIGKRLHRDHSTIHYNVHMVDDNWPRYEPFVMAVADAIGLNLRPKQDEVAA
jgi:chromosomal replication initiation ATPase DnaA